MWNILWKKCGEDITVRNYIIVGSTSVSSFWKVLNNSVLALTFRENGSFFRKKCSAYSKGVCIRYFSVDTLKRPQLLHTSPLPSSMTELSLGLMSAFDKEWNLSSKRMSPEMQWQLQQEPQLDFLARLALPKWTSMYLIALEALKKLSSETKRSLLTTTERKNNS